MKKVIVIILATLVAQGYSQRFCYICDNCNDPFDVNDHTRVQCTPDNVFRPPGQETPPPDGSTTQPTLTPPTEAPPPADTTPLPPIDGTPTTTLFPPTPAGEVPPLPQAPQGLYRKRRSAVVPLDDPAQNPALNPAQDPAQDPNQPFRCFIAHRDIAGNRQTQRGCALYMEEDTCPVLGVSGDNCRVCNSDGCNSGTRFTLSILTLIAALFIAIRLH